MTERFAMTPWLIFSWMPMVANIAC